MKKKQLALLLGKSPEEFYDWSGDLRYNLSVRAYHFFHQMHSGRKKTVIEILEQDIKKDPAPRNFGKKTWLEVVAFFKECGIKTDNYPFSKWF